MPLTEAARKKMSKNEVIEITVKFQGKFYSIVASTADWKSDFRSLESKLFISRSVNSKICDRLTCLERQC